MGTRSPFAEKQTRRRLPATMRPEVPVPNATLKGSAMTEKTASVHWEIALAAKRECPLSKALAAVAEISLQATLEAAAT